MWPKRLQGQRKVVGQVEQEGKEGCDVWKGSSDPDVVSCDPDVLVLTDTLPSCVHASTPTFLLPLMRA